MSYAYGSTSSHEFLDNHQQNSSSSVHSNYGSVLSGQREYPSPAPSMSSANAPSPSAYSFPEAQIESQIGPSVPNRIMTRGQRKAAAAMNAGIKSLSRSQTPHQGYPLTPDSISSPSVHPSSSVARQLSASPALSSISSHSHRSQRLIQQQQQYRITPASPAVSPTAYNFHLPGPSLLPSAFTHPHPPPPPTNVIPRPYIKAKQRKQRLFNIDRKAICEYHLAHPNEKQELIARQYGVERSTISKILKHKEKWLNMELDEARGCGTNGTGMPLRHAKHRPSKFPPVEFEMQQWLMAVSDKYYGSLPNTYDPHNAPLHGPLSDASLREKALSVARSHGITPEQFKASSGWVENFKHRHGIKNGFWGGYLRNVQGRNAFAGLPGTTPVPAPPPLASSLASKLPSKEYIRYPTSSVKAPQENEESDSEDDDDDDDADMEGSSYRQPHSALSSLRDTTFSRPPWSTGSASTSGSGESLASPLPNGHHHVYANRPPWSSGSTASHPSTPTEPLHEQYRRSDEHCRSATGLSVATMDLSAPGSPSPYVHSQSPMEHVQHSHLHSQSTTDPHTSHGQSHVHPTQECQVQHQNQHQQVYYPTDPDQTRYAYATNVEHDAQGSATELSSYSSQYQNQDGQQHGSYAAHQTVESSIQAQAPTQYQQHIHPPKVQMHGINAPVPSLMDNSVPTHAECEHFLTKLCLYADTPRSQGGGGGPEPLLSARRRDWLTKLKVVFFEAGSGIPVTPDSDDEKRH